jgi:peptidoglycan/LPS O-acetylase OafA/YrhL
MALLLAQRVNLVSELIVPLFFVIPAFMALGLGITSRRRRWGATSGAVLAVSLVIAVMIGTGLHARISPADLNVFALMIGTGALLGAVGAEGRRLVSKRLVKNRSHRTVIRERAL